MLQLSDGQATNPCFCFPSLLKRLVDSWPQIRALNPPYCMGGRERVGGREGGREGEWERERERARNEFHGELKSLVASPLHWLPRDQQGAKSTQGRKKCRVFRGGRRRDSEWWRDKETQKRGRVEGQREMGVYLACVSPLLSLKCSALPLTRGQTISGLAVNIKGDGFLFCPWLQGNTDHCNTDSTLSHYIKNSAAILKDFTAQNVLTSSYLSCSVVSGSAMCLSG